MCCYKCPNWRDVKHLCLNLTFGILLRAPSVFKQILILSSNYGGSQKNNKQTTTKKQMRHKVKHRSGRKTQRIQVGFSPVGFWEHIEEHSPCKRK